jgi:hypothetical protein
MKKYLSLLIVISVLLTLFVGCSKSPETSETESTTKAETASVKLIIDGNKFSEDFSETAFYEELDAIEGLFHTKNNETNEYTLTMTESAYKELKDIKSKPVKDAYNDIINDAENYVTDIKYDDDFRNVKVYAEKDKVPEEFSDFDATLIKVMGSAMAYQIYTIEGQSVNITVFDAQNEEILKTVSYPVVLE